ncbi:MAG TPA: class D sortase [Steroidobacteraceae bacterium]|nr:class D sortase [Steroidobacteraceae bacterium]
MSHSTHRRLLRWSEAALWISGAALCSLFAIAQADSALGSTDALEEFAASVNPPDQTLWAQSRVRDYQAAQQSPTKAIAVLTIPSLKLEVPVFDGEDEISLNRGAGLVAGMGKPDSGGNVGIAGHRDGYFRALKDIEVGDLIEVRTRVKMHRYRVTAIDIVDKADKRRLADTDEPGVTLITCYPFYYLGNAPQRYIVAATYEWPSDS